MVRSVVGILLLGVLVAGCGSPKDSIRQSCVRDGGVKISGSVQASREQIKTSCECFSTQIAAALPKDQLKVVAQAMKDGKSEQVMSSPVMMAAKSCAVS